jgi:hypothetical protein
MASYSYTQAGASKKRMRLEFKPGNRRPARLERVMGKMPDNKRDNLRVPEQFSPETNPAIL